MNNLLTAIKAFVLKSRPAYKDYLGDGKYDVKKLPEECLPDSVSKGIKKAQSGAESAWYKAESAWYKAESAWYKADAVSGIVDNAIFHGSFQNLDYRRDKTNSYHVGLWTPLAGEPTTLPVIQYGGRIDFEASDGTVIKSIAIPKNVARTKSYVGADYKLRVDDQPALSGLSNVRIQIGYKKSDGEWKRFTGIWFEVASDAEFKETFDRVHIVINTMASLNDYEPWPSICMPIASVNDAGVVYAPEKTDDQTLPVSIDANGYLWCKDAGIINSSTSGSTKKFKITVDDSGTLSATEVT